MNLFSKDNFNFALPKPVYVYTDIIKPNFVADPYLRIVTTVHFSSNTGYHRFNYPLYGPEQQSSIESKSIRLLTKTGEVVLFEDGDIPYVVTIDFKEVLSVIVFSMLVTMHRYTRYYANQSGGGGGGGDGGGGGEMGRVYRASIRVQTGNGRGSFFRGLYRFVKTMMYSGAKAVGKEELKRVSI